jgi:5'-nucleotidase
MKKTIAVDMDGVLADVFSQFALYHQKEFGVLYTPEDKMGISELDSFPNIHQYIHSVGFFRNVGIMPNAVEVLSKLNEKHQVYIVSAAIEFPLSLNEKLEWLQEYFPFITWKQIVFCGSKQIIKADIMIDDHFKNLDYFEGQSILFTQPHNALFDNGKHIRVHSWLEIEKILNVQ